MYRREYLPPQLVLRGVGGLWSRWRGYQSFMLSLHAQNKWTNSRAVAENDKQLPLVFIKCFKRAGTKSALFTAESPTPNTHIGASARYAFFESVTIRPRAKHCTLSHLILSTLQQVLLSIHSRCDSGGSEWLSNYEVRELGLESRLERLLGLCC